MLSSLKSSLKLSDFKILQWLLIALFLGICFLNFYGWLLVSRFEGDIASRMVLALGPQLGIGRPYTELWEIIPPGYILVFQAWASVFGTAVLAFNLLHLLVLLGTCALLFLMAKQYFKSLSLYIVVATTAVTLISPYIQTMYLSSESLGVFFSLLGFVCLLYGKNPWSKYSGSVAAFIMAGQMKDPFLFGAIAILPMWIWDFGLAKSPSVRVKLFLAGLVGVLAPIGAMLVYLLGLGSLSGYLEVLQYKTVFGGGVPFPVLINRAWNNFKMVYPMFIYFRLHLPTLAGAAIVVKFLSSIFKYFSPRIVKDQILIIPQKQFKVKDLQFRITETEIKQLCMILFIFGSFIGMTMQDRFSTHYLIQAVVPLYMFLAITVSMILQPLTTWPKKRLASLIGLGLSTLLLGVMMVPKPEYIKAYLENIPVGNPLPEKNFSQVMGFLVAGAPSPHSDVLAAEAELRNNLKPDDCILYLYGWHVATAFIYTQHPPCTRFFLPNIVTEDWQRTEYLESVMAHPPAAMIYGRGGADFDIKNFEARVLNFPAILAACYTADAEFIDFYETFPATLYWAKYQAEDLKSCYVTHNTLTTAAPINQQ